VQSIKHEFPEGTKLLEIWARLGKKHVLFATHWIEYTRWNGAEPSSASVHLSNGKELRIDIVPVKGGEAGLRRVGVQLDCGPTGKLQDVPSNRGRQRWDWFAPRYAMALLLLAVGWIATALLQHRQIANDEARIQQLNQGIAEQQVENSTLRGQLETHHIQSFALIPDELRLRGAGPANDNLVQLSPRSDLLVLGLPVASNKVPYRAVLKAFLTTDRIVDESFLAVQVSGDDIRANLSVPSSLLEDGRDYIVDLYSRDASGTWITVHTFLFHLVKR